MGATGLERGQPPQCKTHVHGIGGAKCGARRDITDDDPRLERIAEVWDDLPEGVKAAVWSVVEVNIPHADTRSGRGSKT